MATAISGFRGRVVVSSALGGAEVALLATKWSVTYKTELQDASSFEEVTGGVAGALTPISRYVTSMSDLEFNLDAFYDAENGIIPILKPGANIKCQLFTNKGVASGVDYAGAGATKKFEFNAIVENLTVDTEVRGVIKYTLSGKVSGGGAIIMA
jgi:hypothetical protein